MLSFKLFLDRRFLGRSDHDHQHRDDYRGFLPPFSGRRVSRRANGSRWLVARRNSQRGASRHAQLPPRGIQRGTRQ